MTRQSRIHRLEFQLQSDFWGFCISLKFLKQFSTEVYCTCQSYPKGIFQQTQALVKFDLPIAADHQTL